MPADLIPHRLGPFSGLDVVRADDRAIQAQPMRGGYNVMPVDGELHSRFGTDLFKRSLCSEWFDFVFSYFHGDGSVRTYLIGHYAVLQLNAAWTTVTVPYTAAVTENWAYTANSATATSSTVRTIDQVVIDTTKATAYRIVNVAGTTVTLDRPYEGTTTGSRSTDVYNPIGASTGADVAVGPIGSTSGVGQVGFTIFRQQVTHAGAALWATSSAVTAGAVYLVVTTGLRPPVAIRLDASAALCTSIWQDTSLSPAVDPQGSSKVYPRYCAAYKDRLFLAFANDANTTAAQQNPERTIWYSQTFDLEQWHTGVAGNNATPNYVTFTEGDDHVTGIRTLGDQLVIHRERSQEICQFQGSGAYPFQFYRNNQGIGCLAGASLVTFDRMHYFWSESGPCSFDGQSVQSVQPHVMRALVPYGGTSQPPNPTFDANNIVGVTDPIAGVVYWAVGTTRDPLATFPASSGGTVVAYDIRRETWWFEDYAQILGAGFARKGHAQGRIAFVRQDGTMVVMGSATWANGPVGYDAGITSGQDTVDNYFETKWMDFGDPLQKELEKLDLELRSINHESPYTKLDLSAQGVASGDNLYLSIDLYTDHNMDTSRQTLEFTYKLSSFPTALEGYRAEPRIRLRLPARIGTFEVVKLVVKNKLPAGGVTAAGVSVKKAPFRVSQITAWVKHGEAQRRLGGN